MKSGIGLGPSDAALVDAARAGDRGAFAELFERYQEMLVAVCLRALGNAQAVDDVVQEAALAALLGIGGLRDPERFGPWLVGIGLNVCRRWRQDLRTHQWSWEAVVGGGLLHRLIDPRLDPAEMASEREFAREVRRAVDGLSPGQRDAVLLFYFAGFSYREMKVALGIEITAVKARLHKARARLRRELWSLWKEDELETTQQAGMVEMRLAEVLRLPPEEGRRGPTFVVLLEEVSGERSLPIWVGQAEATWLAMALEKTELPRPSPYAMTAGLLEGLGSRVREVRIERLVECTYYAVIVADRQGATTSIDARPSDALNLALLTGSPVLVAPDVLERSRVEGDDPRHAGLARHRRDDTAAGAATIASEAVAEWQRSLAELSKEQGVT